MGFADDFRALDFLEQAEALQQLQQKPASEAIQDLLPLFITPSGDTAADTMVRNTLRSLYLSHHPSVLDGLTHEAQPVRTMCLELAGELRIEAAVAPLLGLCVQAEQNNDTETLTAVISALSRTGSTDALPVLRKHARHENDFVSGMCIQGLGSMQDTESIPLLADILEVAQSEERYETCDLGTWKAIEALGNIATPEALQSLVRFLHHNNPTARRIVMETLVEAGEYAVPAIAPALSHKDSDVQIMAANALRDIQHKSSADPLIAALDAGAGTHPNVGFAIYEALGHTPGVKSLVALTDALPKEDEPSTLMAVIIALEHLASPSVGNKVLEIIRDRMSASDPQAQRILNAVISARATKLFTYLHADEIIGRLLVTYTGRHGDPYTIKAFTITLRDIGTDRATQDANHLTQSAASTQASDTGRPRLLGIDDSAAMRNFYRAHGSDMGFDVSLAENGKEALDIIEEEDTPFDIIVVDMNMPIMDGIEFSGKVRNVEGYAQTPILMATTESGRSQAQLARKSGVTSFLPKPFTPEILQRRLNKLLESSD